MNRELLFPLLHLTVIGGVLARYAGLIALSDWAYRTYAEHRDCKQHQESSAAVTTYYKVLDLVGGDLTDQNFQEALRYTIRKHHLGDKHDMIDFDGSDLDYLAELIAETVQQDRLWRDTLNIIKAGEQPANIKKEIA